MKTSKKLLQEKEVLSIKRLILFAKIFQVMAVILGLVLVTFVYFTEIKSDTPFWIQITQDNIWKFVALILIFMGVYFITFKRLSRVITDLKFKLSIYDTQPEKLKEPLY